jgi:HlyD family secretion protein
MNRISIFTLAALLSLTAASCSKNKKTFDASGTFEADEVIISAEATGTIRQLVIGEGSTIAAGQVIGFIDSVQLYLKKKQLEAQIEAVLSKRPNVPVQLAALREQLKTAEREQQRISSLVKSDAAPSKQLDDINAQVEVLQRQITAQQSALEISSDGLSKDVMPLQLQVEQLNDQLSKCRIVNPVTGTVLVKYAEANEMAAAGKPLYKIADLTTITLRAYITSDQLALVKLNQQVKVMTDDGKGGMREMQGTVTWINDKAEFTPKTIQTKDERANTVYAMKVNLKNDGTLKIGMYGEVKF